MDNATITLEQDPDTALEEHLRYLRALAVLLSMDAAAKSRDPGAGAAPWVVDECLTVAAHLAESASQLHQAAMARRRTNQEGSPCTSSS